MKTIAIAGASGFVGKRLVEALLKKTSYNIRALSRSSKDSQNPRLKWIEADLFSVLDIEKGLNGADIAIYLVHSMQPSAHLDQASFSDYDLILADNFGRACKVLGIKQVLYLGGLVPQEGEISRHLASRLEVETTLQEYVANTTVFRAAIILGKGGSSFHILLNLVKRLPVMICPRWTAMPTSPVHVDYACDCFLAALDNQKHWGKTYDLAASNQISYLQLLKNTASFLGLKTKFFYLNGWFIGLSRLWVSLVSGAPKSLVYPLLSSLKNKMVPSPERLFPEDEVRPESVEQGLEKALKESQGLTYKFTTRTTQRKTVRSVQRSAIPSYMSAEDVAKEYMAWLPRAMRPFLIVDLEGNNVRFCLLSKKLLLLCLTRSPERSEPDRQIFYIKGGLLAAPQDRGRLEFREVLEHKWMLAAIHDFYPALPWYIYIYTQALAHLIVMKLFGRHLRLIAEGKRTCVHQS